MNRKRKIQTTGSPWRGEERRGEIEISVGSFQHKSLISTVPMCRTKERDQKWTHTVATTHLLFFSRITNYKLWWSAETLYCVKQLTAYGFNTDWVGLWEVLRDRLCSASLHGKSIDVCIVSACLTSLCISTRDICLLSPVLEAVAVLQGWGRGASSNLLSISDYKRSIRPE